MSPISLYFFSACTFFQHQEQPGRNSA